MSKDWINVDGSVKSGSGTLLRYSLAASSILGENLHIFNIRAKRKKTGLMAQHLKAVQACAELSGGSLQQVYKGSMDIFFSPGIRIKGGNFSWDIGTAGSTTLMGLCLLPIGSFAKIKSVYTFTGGLFQDFAPNPFHMKNVLLKLLKRCSISAELEMIKPGYVPLGGGIFRLNIEPLSGCIKPIRLREQGKIKTIKGLSISSHLKERQVSKRMAEACQRQLAQKGYNADIECIYDEKAIQKGAALFLYAMTDSGCIIGSDMSGKIGRTSEKIGKTVAARLFEDIEKGATIDRFTADQMIFFAALADGVSEYIIPCITDHIDTNLWFVEKILGAKVSLEGQHLKIEGVAMKRE